MRHGLVALLLAALGCAAPVATRDAPRDLREELLRVARARSAALVARDAPTLTAILDEAFVYTNASGEVLDRARYLDRYVHAPDVRWHAQELDDVDVRVHGETAIVTARVHDRASFGANELDAHFRSTFVYVSTPAGWRCIAGHTSSDARR